MRKSAISLWGIAALAGLAIACGLPSNDKDGGAGAADKLPVDTGKLPAAGDEAAAPEATLPPGTITDTGELLVGTDIKPGTYRGVECGYWARLKDGDGELDSILANDNAGSDEYVTVTILKTDYAFDNSCAALMPITYLRTVPKSNRSEVFGTLVVGKDIHPGTWRGTAIADCYWARLSGFTGDLGSVIANNNVDAGSKFTVTVKASDKGLEIGSDCGPISKVS